MALTGTDGRGSRRGAPRVQWTGGASVRGLLRGLLMPDGEEADSGRVQPPSLGYAFAELPRAILEFMCLLPAHPLVLTAPRGDGPPVIPVARFRGNQNTNHN